METPKELGAQDGAPTFVITAEQMPELKGYRAGHVCDFTLTAKLTSVDNGKYTFRWEELSNAEKEVPAEKQPGGYEGMSQFKKAVYGGRPAGKSTIKYVRLDTGPSVS